MQTLLPRLLVVEDDATIARALSRVLARAGFSVAIARSCSAARALTQPFDFAILDLDLPDGNGVALAEELLGGEHIARVVFFTGTSHTSLLGRAQRLGKVVLKSSGVAEVLAQLKQDIEPGAPENRSEKSERARGARTVSGTVSIGTHPAASHKTRAR